MPLECPRCRKVIEFSGERPSFCPYCGVSLSSAGEQTASYVPTATERTAEWTGAAAEPGTDGVPTAIGGYQLVRLLGAGGMGAVYEGHGEDASRRVAVKLLTTQAHAGPAALERFRQEGRLASQITHPNCVFVLQADEEAGRPFIVMELMGGGTLRELVKERGPLSPAEAVAKILDVIDGLIEAHRLNILHRDVKPSNCFLMADGRVKVGDFGLSKSLSVDNNLTQTGSFLGTVLYAAPEQIRGDPLDYSADVYSVCATLYFLLSGRAPFQHENPTVVISRVISESPPELRLLRPQLPQRLERAVMRGLDRLPEKRWQTLEELRTELAEFAGRSQKPARLGPRVIAFLIDNVVLMPFWFALGFVEALIDAVSPFSLGWELVIYCVVMEWRFGRTVGKWVLRLRVVEAGGGGRLTLARAIGRAAAFFGIIIALPFALPFAVEYVGIQFGGVSVDSAAVLWLLTQIVAIGFLFWTARRPDLQTLHDRLSGTRVVQLPWPRGVRRIVPVREVKRNLRPIREFPELPDDFGGFQPLGVLDRAGGVYHVYVWEPKLNRDLDVWLSDKKLPAMSDARRTVSRPTRPRWLSGGETGRWAWDAFLAPLGAPLTQVVEAGRALGWPESQTILEQVAAELVDSRTDAPLQGPLSCDQVHVRPDGRVQLAERFLTDEPPSDDRDLRFLAAVARTALEGQVIEADSGRPVRAVMPLHATGMVNRLTGGANRYQTVQEFRHDLEANHGLPAEATSQIRAVQIGFHVLMIAPALVLLFAVSGLLNGFTVAGLQSRREFLDASQQRLTAMATARATQSAGPDLERIREAGQILESSAAQIDDYLQLYRPGLNAAERLFVRLSDYSTLDDADADTLKSVAEKDMWAALAQARLGGPPEPLRSVENHARLNAGSMATSIAVLSAVLLVLWAAWAFATRGGLSMAMAGLALVRNDGRRAPRWRCALRTLIVWTPPLALLYLCVLVKTAAPGRLLAHNLLWWAAALLVVGYGVIAAFRPARGPHDRLSGVHVVPR